MYNTKERILLTALRLFARDGYEAVSTSMIAGELGMTKGALYKHYKNKQDIFDCIIERMYQIDRERSTEYGVPVETYENDPLSYKNVSMEQDIAYTKEQFRFFTKDEFGVNFRKMLTLEQYRNPVAADMYQKILSSGVFAYSIDIIREMIDEGILKKGDPELIALEFCGAMYLLISLSDAAYDRDRLENLMDAHIKQLIEKYSVTST